MESLEGAGRYLLTQLAVKKFKRIYNERVGSEYMCGLLSYVWSSPELHNI
jgi:hypothetical protein